MFLKVNLNMGCSPLLKLGVLLAAAMSASLPVSAQTEPGSFLVKPAHTTEELVRQVRQNPKVRSRFARHFEMKDSEVDSFLSSLRPARLQREGVYTVYNIRPGERISSRNFELKKGAWVFADRYGRPMLKKACANPLAKRPLDLREAPSDVVAFTTPPADLRELVAEGEPMELYVMAEILEPAIDNETTPTVPEVPTIVTEGENPMPMGGGGGGGGGDVAFGLLLPLLFPSSNGGGGGGNGPPPPIPGPAAVLVFGLPLARAMLKRNLKD